jgi:transcriptional regulator with XRE-family HTH domain
MVQRHEVVHRTGIEVAVINGTMPTPYSGTLGGLMRRARQQRDLSVDDLCARWRVSPATLLSYEDGTGAVAVEQFARWCALLRLSPGVVLQEVGRRLTGEPTERLDITQPLD